MGAIDRVRLRSGLHNVELGKDTVFLFEVHTQSVRSSRLDPILRPRVQILMRYLFELSQQIVQRSVSVAETSQIVTHAFKEFLAPAVVSQTLQNSCTFSVGDTVEVHQNVVQILDFSRDRMRSRVAILPEPP